MIFIIKMFFLKKFKKIYDYELLRFLDLLTLILKMSQNDYSSDTNEQLLKAMGFTDQVEMREALSIANNDINEAVAILTNEKLPKITTLNNNNNNNNTSNSIGNDTDIDMTDSADNMNSSQVSKDKDISIINENPLIFPIDCLIQLENNVFTDNWSIPYRKDEWLGRILISTIALLKEDLADSDINCNRFINIVYPKL